MFSKEFRRVGYWAGAGVLLSCTAMVAAEAPAHGTLRGTVLDGRSGQETACTVAVTDASGRLVTNNPSFSAGIRSQGRFELQVPAGKTRVRVTRGFETRAVEQVVEVEPGGTQQVEIQLERLVDLRARGWFGGDSHAHMNHGERTVPVTFDYVALTAKAEDLQYLSLAQAWSIDDPTPENLERELGARSTPDCVLTWNLEAPKNYYQGDAGRCLGHCWMLGVNGRTKEGADVIKVLMDASAHDYESDKPTFLNFESHHLIQAQGGTVFYTHPARWWTGDWGGRGGYPKREKMRVSNMAVELPLNTVIGPTYDGLDVITGPGEFEANAKAFELWCLLLNRGYRLAATASSDACFDRIGGAVPGAVRTYTHLDGPFSLRAVARATAQGRTFATSGPLLDVRLAGKPPGHAFPADGSTRELRIEAWASGTDPKGLSLVEVLRNGKVLHAMPFSPDVGSVLTNVPVTQTENAWYCVRVYGSDPRRQRAISGAFYFDEKPYSPPAPVVTDASVNLVDAATGEPLRGTVREVEFHGTLPRPQREHSIPAPGGIIQVSPRMRLQAKAPGYRPQTQSLILGDPELVRFVTELSAEDLLKWETYEETRRLLRKRTLTFRLQKDGGRSSLDPLPE